MLPLGSSISRRKPYFHIIYFIVSALGKLTLGNAALIAWAVLTYSHLRKPRDQGVIFQLSLSLNNKRSMDRVNAVLAKGGIEGICFNGEPIGMLDRLRLLLACRGFWESAKALTRDGHKIPFIRVQQILGCASFLAYSQIIPATRPRIVCVANDHAPVCIGLLETARTNGIPTVYVQHAPVADHFPPLNYDISVLFDRWSEDAYARAGEYHGVSELKGSVVILPPFADRYQRPRLNTDSYRIGIGLSLLFKDSALDKLLSELTRDDRVRQVLLRPHPRCRANLSSFVRSAKIAITDGRRDPQAFLDDVDVILVPNSGFAVDALHAGKVTLFVPGLDTAIDDYYGFVRNQILPVYNQGFLDSPEALASFFDDAWETRFAKLDATVATPAGHAEKQLINEFRKVLGNGTNA